MVNIKSFKIGKSHNNNIMPEGVPILRVVTREEPPYVMKCLNCSSLSGNQSVAYQGFAIDLLDAISKVSIKSQWEVNDIFSFSMATSRLLASTTLSTWSPTISTGCSTTRPKSGMASSGKNWRRYWTKVYLIKEIKIKLNKRNFQGTDRQKGRYSGRRNDHQLCQVFCQFVDSIGPITRVIDCAPSILPITREVRDKCLNVYS